MMTLESRQEAMAKAREALARKREQAKKCLEQVEEKKARDLEEYLSGMKTKEQFMNTTSNQIQEAAPAQPEPGKDNSGGEVFVLYAAGVGSPVVASGPSYEAMWAHAVTKVGMTQDTLIKHGYTFDVVSAKEAQRLMG